jgi:hypothetical protein
MNTGIALPRVMVRDKRVKACSPEGKEELKLKESAPMALRVKRARLIGESL